MTTIRSIPRHKSLSLNPPQDGRNPCRMLQPLDPKLVLQLSLYELAQQPLHPASPRKRV
jgi:hypothetical protein